MHLGGASALFKEVSKIGSWSQSNELTETGMRKIFGTATFNELKPKDDSSDCNQPLYFD